MVVRRHRCHEAPGSTEAIAFTRPAWSSLVTSFTPDRPRAARPRRNASQPAPSSELVTSMPRISRYPSALTPVAIRQCTFTVRPPSRTFWVSASIHTNVYGPASSGRFRNPSTISSSSAAIALTATWTGPPRPGRRKLFHPPGRDPQQVRRVATTEASARSARGGAPGTTGSTTRPAASGSPARSSPPGYPTPAAGTRSASSPGPASPPVPRVTPDLDVSVHHPLGELPDHLPQHIRARRCQGLLELRAANRHNVTWVWLFWSELPVVVVLACLEALGEASVPYGPEMRIRDQGKEASGGTVRAG